MLLKLKNIIIYGLIIILLFSLPYFYLFVNNKDSFNALSDDLKGVEVLNSADSLSTCVNSLSTGEEKRVVLSGNINYSGFKPTNVVVNSEVKNQLYDFPVVSDDTLIQLLTSNKYVYTANNSRVSYNLEGELIREVECYELLGLNIGFADLYSILRDYYKSDENSQYGYSGVNEHWSKSLTDYSSMGKKLYGVEDILVSYNQNDFDMLISNASHKGISIVGTLICTLSKDDSDNIVLSESNLYIGHLENIQKYSDFMSLAYLIYSWFLILSIISFGVVVLIKYISK